MAELLTALKRVGALAREIREREAHLAEETGERLTSVRASVDDGGLGGDVGGDCQPAACAAAGTEGG